jgi:hypothetical protein
VGRFFSVNEDTGALRFWHYTGRGEEDPTGAKGFTEPGNNSSNQIGRGFGSMLHMLGDHVLPIARRAPGRLPLAAGVPRSAGGAGPGLV